MKSVPDFAGGGGDGEAKRQRASTSGRGLRSAGNSRGSRYSTVAVSKKSQTMNKAAPSAKTSTANSETAVTLPSPVHKMPPPEVENQTRVSSSTYLRKIGSASSIDEITFLLLANGFGANYARTVARQY